MKPMVSFTVFFFFSVLIQECKADCYPLAGTETNITCRDATRSADGLFWRAEVGGEIMDVANCISPGSCVSLYKDIFVASLDNTTSYLTIKKASRTHPFNMDTRWFCTYHKDKQNYTACGNMYIVEKAEKPTCGPLTLNSTTLKLYITCSTERVYPQGYCSFAHSEYGNGTWTRYSSPQTYGNTELNETLEYYSTECSFEIPLERLRLYGMFYSIRMYPQYGSVTLNAVYTDIKEIHVALVDDQEDDDDNDDNDVLFILVIILGAALGVAVLAVVVLAIVVCRNKQTRELEQTRKIPKQKKETRQVKDISHPKLLNLLLSVRNIMTTSTRGHRTRHTWRRMRLMKKWEI